jgi:arylsulfatase A-like enzyme
MNRFASESLVLSDMIASYPLCRPSRAMLIPGYYPYANKVTANSTSESEPYGEKIQEYDRCWSDVLKENEHNLGYIGK